MSKTMPKMKLWQKITSKGEKAGALPTAKKLKQMLDASIKEFLKSYTLDKISQTTFQTSILNVQDQTILSNFKITLYKNGKTVKVTKLTLSQKMAVKITIPKLDLSDSVGYFGTDTWKSKKQPPNPFSKKSKKIILEGKMIELVKFHLERKHALEWEICLACKAIRAFVQWEFHQPAKLSSLTKKKDKPLKSGVAAALMGNAAIKAKQAEIEIEIIKAASESSVIKNVTVKSLKEDDLLFKSDDELFKEESDGIN